MILEKIKKIVAEQLNVDEAKIKMETRILEDLSADSLDMVEMITEIEDQFNVSITDEQIVTLKTVGDLVKFLEK